jgi:hypothetical protein
MTAEELRNDFENETGYAYRNGYTGRFEPNYVLWLEDLLIRCEIKYEAMKRDRDNLEIQLSTPVVISGEPLRGTPIKF